MSNSDQLKSTFQAVQSGVSASDKSYRIGYATAVAISWIGIALVFIGLIVAVGGFFGALVRNFSLYYSILSTTPGLSLSLTGLGIVLSGQLARAIFDMSRTIQGQSRS